MALSTKTKEVLLHNLFYSPNTHFTSTKSLYEQVKNKGIIQKEVKEFGDNQEYNQLFKITDNNTIYYHQFLLLRNQVKEIIMTF